MQTAAAAVDYLKEVKPVLAARCYACHGALKQNGGLRLDTAEFIRQGGKHGPAIIAGKPAESLLLKKVSATSLDERMPPEGEPLHAPQIAALREWITAGAPVPKDEKPESDPREHWAFKAPVKPAVPVEKVISEEVISQKAKAPARSQSVPASPLITNHSPLDAFLEAKRRAQNLPPQPPADPLVWLRRVTLDLTGLPPTRAEIEAFATACGTTLAKLENAAASGGSDSAFRIPHSALEGVVERLLASPHYGERWGRHFMDIWRYSDWWGLGAQLRYSQKHIWHWRDWIVESLNTDKGYDRMIVEQLAGDELAPTDPATLRATGFLARNYYLFNRTTWMDDVVEHTSKAFLGLTMNCVKCHDHKYDPLTTTDYYAMRAIFEPYHARLDELPGTTDLEKDGLPRAYDLHLDRPTFIHAKGDEKKPETNQVIRAAVPVALAFKPLQIQPVNLPPPAHNPALQPWVLTNHLAAAQEQIITARQAAEAAKKKLAEVERHAARTPTSAVPKPDEGVRGSAASPVPAEKVVASAGKPLFTDTYSAANPQLWELLDGEWTYVDGLLRQAQVKSSRSAARSRADHPADFLATFKFRPTGGSVYKSVGFTFDTTEARESLVYLSAHAPGPKLQIAYGKANQYAYPPAGTQARAVKLGETYEITIRVRGSLINVAVNGEHALAFELPERTPGKFQLITYDATADFLAFELSALPADVQLVRSSAPAPAPTAKATTPAAITSPEQARLALKSAELTLAAAELRPSMVRAAWEADSRRDQTNLLAAAALADAKFKLAQAEADIAKAELETVAPSNEPKKKKEPDAEKKLKTAQDALAKAQKAVESPGTSYTSLRATLKAFEGPDETEAHRQLPYPTTSTGRRLAFANWLADRQNPLTARVLVNHVWTRHFGQPLVANLTDFGRRATKPVHAELLDWLAVDFMEHGWSLKRLHRQMVLSEAYRMSSSNAVESRGTKVESTRAPALDPENKFFWRMNPQRMDANVLRDSLLHLAGTLDLTLGGPTIDPKREDSARRSFYFTQSPEDLNKFLEMFDNANTKECYRRDESILPQQALALANSRLVNTAAAKVAERLVQDAESASDDAFIRRTFTTLLATAPTPAEHTLCVESLAQFLAAAKERKAAQPEAKARAAFVHALLNHNDFITIR
ncbi:MAG: PSD1 and planctomycete cytochrome C domain-containing protein [Limisphaerales bacterium]